MPAISSGNDICQKQDLAPNRNDQLEKWNLPRENRPRYLATLLGLTIMGMNDSCVGALIPYVSRRATDTAHNAYVLIVRPEHQIELYYDINYTVVSLLFLTSFVGYFAAALSSNLIHHHFGQRGVAIIAPLCRLAGYIVIACHPPYPVLPAIMLVPGFGNGLEDSAWNAWVGNLQKANELLGVLHGAYGVGATASPLIATAMVTKGNPSLPWYAYYYVMVGVSALELCVTSTAFWRVDAAAFKKKHAPGEQIGRTRTTTRSVLRGPITWVIALFLLGYVGAEVSLGGWITTFSMLSNPNPNFARSRPAYVCALVSICECATNLLSFKVLRVRKADPFLAGLSVTFFWLGLTIGRVTLGFITGRIGEKLAITVYLVSSVALQLLYWQVPSFAASAVLVAFLGFFLGPLFPAAIVAATKLLPIDHHVSAIGFAAAFGGGGAAVFPFAVGAIAQAKGVEVLQPIIVAILSFITLIWLTLPGGFRKGGLEQARERQESVGHELHRILDWSRSKISGAQEEDEY